jgi:hypothetical protein
MTVVVNPNVTPSFAQVAPICSGGGFSLPTTSDNGIAGTWAPAVNNTATTTYTFTPTPGQCATTATMTVNVNPNLTPSFAQVAPICSGGSFSLPTTSSNGIAGTWAPAVNNTTTTTYTFTPNSGQCATTATMTVVVNPNVTPTVLRRSLRFVREAVFRCPQLRTMALRELGAGGKQHSYNHLYLHTHTPGNAPLPPQ